MRPLPSPLPPPTPCPSLAPCPPLPLAARPRLLPSLAPLYVPRRLRRVRDEASMSIDAYRAVFESSITFGVRKLNQVCSRTAPGRTAPAAPPE